MERITLFIKGMTCGHCLMRVTQALGSIASVRVVDARIGRVSLELDPAIASETAARAAVERAGYIVERMERAPDGRERFLHPSRSS